jgi:hypothetical protein
MDESFSEYIFKVNTGSNYIVSPPVTDTDIDYLVYVENLKTASDQLLNQYNYEYCFGANDPEICLEQYFCSRWKAFRKGIENLIVTDDLTLFMRFYAATELCKTLNVKDKEVRVKIFRCIKFGMVAKDLQEVLKDTLHVYS